MLRFRGRIRGWEELCEFLRGGSEYVCTYMDDVDTMVTRGRACIGSVIVVIPTWMLRDQLLILFYIFDNAER
jgi:hypothetical protein